MFCLLSFQVRITLKLKMYCLLTAKAIDITHFLLKFYKTIRTIIPRMRVLRIICFPIQENFVDF